MSAAFVAVFDAPRRSNAQEEAAERNRKENKGERADRQGGVGTRTFVSFSVLMADRSWVRSGSSGGSRAAKWSPAADPSPSSPLPVSRFAGGIFPPAAVPTSPASSGFVFNAVGSPSPGPNAKPV